MFGKACPARNGAVVEFCGKYMPVEDLRGFDDVLSFWLLVMEQVATKKYEVDIVLVG